ncbi:MAG: 3-hydroxybutyryl-CoA dehydrogenase [Ignavibacteriae bacterium]|nr:3-hydroxybutyryl-CoA dehydrogenase [Ignavibacteriota bacterium]
MSKSKKKFLVVGEQPLVNEFTKISREHGFETVAFGKLYISSATAAFELTNINISKKKKHLTAIEKVLPPSTFIFSSSVTVTIAEQATWLDNPERLFGISALPTLLSNSLIELVVPVQVPVTSVLKANSLLHSLGKNSSIIQDRVGMVTPRITCMIINEAFFALMEEIASPGDIDLAMKLGTNYPFGPVEWAKRITFKHIISVLESLQRNLGEERYRIAPLLRQMALHYA